MCKRSVLFAVFAVVSFSASQVFAEVWSIDQRTARLAFASVKNDHIAELHRFTEINGTWTDSKVLITIPVNSIDTLIPIRNERMAEHLLNAAEYPHIEASTSVPPSYIDDLEIGDSIVLELVLTVTIAGQRGQVPAMIQVTKTSDKRLLATTVQPLMIDSQRFGLSAGIEKLRELAGLTRIDLVVPVTFTVTFMQPS